MSKFKLNIDRWKYYLQDYESPDIFIEWTYYAMIGASLQRRVAIGTYPQSHISAPNNVYPNLYVIFIAEPGIGKSQAANQAKYVFSSFDQPDKDGKLKQIIKRAPDSITLEAFTRFLHNNYSLTNIPEEIAGQKGKVYSHSSVAFFCGDELGTLLRENTNDLVIFLNQGWDCGDFHRETKTQGVDLVKNMCISLLGAATPSWVKENVTSRVLGEGFAARCIFVYAGAKRFSRFRYNISTEQRTELEHVRRHVDALSKLYGEVKIPKHVDEWCADWYERKFLVINKSRLLKDYYARKKVHLMKLAMCFHFADSTTMELTIPDFERALAFLEVTEMEMDKALNVAGTNPVYSIAMSILSYLEKKPSRRESYKQIIVDFFSDGTMEDLVNALQWLVQIGKIDTIDGWYQLKQSTEEKE